MMSRESFHDEMKHPVVRRHELESGIGHVKLLTGWLPMDVSRDQNVAVLLQAQPSRHVDATAATADRQDGESSSSQTEVVNASNHKGEASECAVDVSDDVPALREEIARLQRELQEKEETMQSLKTECQDLKARHAEGKRFSFDDIAGDNDLVRFYTGLPDVDSFYSLLDSLEKHLAAGLI